MNTDNTSRGLGFPTILFIVFLILKLTHVIDWNWAWVISPLWIPTVLFILVFMAITPFTKIGVIWVRLLAEVGFAAALALIAVIVLVVGEVIGVISLLSMGLPLLLLTIIVAVVCLNNQ